MEPVSSVRVVGQKEALREQLAGASDSTRAVADAVDVAPSTLHAWGDVSIDSHIPSARIPAFLKATPENPALVRYWAGLVGCTLVRLPQTDAGRVDVAQLADLAQSFAALLLQHTQASRDGKWTAREFDMYRQIASDLAARALAHVAHVERQVKVEVLNARRVS